jgi:hypothetical protein
MNWLWKHYFIVKHDYILLLPNSKVILAKPNRTIGDCNAMIPNTAGSIKLECRNKCHSINY